MEMQTNYRNGYFYPSNTILNGNAVFTTLPNKMNVNVNARNLFQVGNIVPISMLAAAIQGVKFGFNFNQPLAFYDLETDTAGEKFTWGVVNGEVFTNPDDMVTRLMQFPVRIGHNIHRFDNPVLYTNVSAPTRFFEVYELGKFKVYQIRGGLDVDLMFFMRMFPLDDMRLYSVARDRGLQFTDYDTFTEYKCIQDVELTSGIFWSLNIPELADVINHLTNIDLTILQNVFFDRQLRYFILTEYMRQHMLPTAYPKGMGNMTDRVEGLLKIGIPGEYTDPVYYYDAQSAYPTTAINARQSIYPGETVIPDLEQRILDIPVSETTRHATKKIANAIIGYMNDKQNYFCNPYVWYNTVTRFNKLMLDATAGIKMIWANLDGFMTETPVNVTIPGYNVRMKDIYNYLRIYNPNKYIGISTDSKTVTIKGFSHSRIPAVEQLDAQFKNLIIETRNIDEALKKVQVPKIGWEISVRKTSDACTRLDLLEYWEDLEIGFTELQLPLTKQRELFADWKNQFY